MHENLWQTLEKYKYPSKSGLIYENEFTFLIAILLSAQARDDFVNIQTKSLFHAANTAEKMHNLGLTGIENYINKIGLWKNKAKNIYSLCKQVIDLKKIQDPKSWYDEFFNYAYSENDMQLYSKPISKEGIPSFRAGLLQFAGIGRKSANVFLNIIYNAPVFSVDTHVHRVTQRLGIAEGNVLKIEEQLEATVPKEYKTVACNWIVWHGRNICTAIKPKCETCKLKEYCEYFKKNNNV